MIRKTEVVNLRLAHFDVYIGRAGRGEAGPFGNPFRLASEADRADCLRRYEAWFLARVESDPEFRRRVLALRGKRLGCFCRPEKACHGDIIARWVGAQPEDR